MVDNANNSPAVKIEESKTMINQSWVSALVKEDVFEGDPSTWRVTEGNYRQVMLALKLNVQQFE